MGRTFCRADRDGDWWIDYVDGAGVRRRERGAPTQRAARKLLQAKEEEAALVRAGAQNAVQDVTFEAFSVPFLEWARAHKRPTTARRYALCVRTLMPVFGKQRLSAIRKRQIEQFMADRKARGRGSSGLAPVELAPATVNRDVMALKRIFNKAIEWDNARTNPVRGIRLLRENNTIVRFLSHAERRELLRHCHGQLRPIVELALNTGMRRGELLALTWSCIDFEQGQIHVRDSKNGEGRYIPMTDGARACLSGIPRQLGSPYLFPGAVDGEPTKEIKRGWYATLRRAGIENFRFHNLRHTFASYLSMAGATQREIQDFLGHKSLAMTNRYSHLSPSHRQQAIRRLDVFLACASGTDAPAGNQVAASCDREAV